MREEFRFIAALQAFTKSTGGDIWFGLPVTATLSSVVTLTVNADSLTLVTNQSPGQVISATMCTFNNATCGGFTALNQRGYLTAVVRNSGYIAAAYTVEVQPPKHEQQCLKPCSEARAILSLSTSSSALRMIHRTSDDKAERN